MPKNPKKKKRSGKSPLWERILIALGISFFPIALIISIIRQFIDGHWGLGLFLSALVVFLILPFVVPGIIGIFRDDSNYGYDVLDVNKIPRPSAFSIVLWVLIGLLALSAIVLLLWARFSNSSASGIHSPSVSSSVVTSDDSEIAYIGNRNSMKFHKPTCEALPDPSNRINFSTREEAVSKGFVACKRCKP